MKLKKAETKLKIIEHTIEDEGIHVILILIFKNEENTKTCIDVLEPMTCAVKIKFQTTTTLHNMSIWTCYILYII